MHSPAKPFFVVFLTPVFCPMNTPSTHVFLNHFVLFLLFGECTIPFFDPDVLPSGSRYVFLDIAILPVFVTFSEADPPFHVR